MADIGKNRENEYGEATGKAHLKAFGQFFTPEIIARFMCSWTCRNGKTMLDPAVGNGIFLREAARANPSCIRRGYELDGHVLDFFGRPQGAEIVQGDYLALDWENKYDAIVCNPPYNRFQAVGNRAEILDGIYGHTGVKCAGNSNLYVLFLLKSIYQMGPQGRLAYIVPSEFLNSAYGEPVKKILLDQGLLRTVISFDSRQDVFQGANTTCCIILADREPKEEMAFYHIGELAELANLDIENDLAKGLTVGYGEISYQEKWRKFLFQEPEAKYHNLVAVEKYCRISRGIATGANQFFCLTAEEAERLSLPKEVLQPCICRGRDVEEGIFAREDFRRLAASGKKAYLLSIEGECDAATAAYIRQGEAIELPKRYVLSKRHPWYAMEEQNPAPILISAAYRGRIKVLRNLAGVKYLSAFHGVYIRPEYSQWENTTFCYLLTDIGQGILRSNRKEMGRGLEKFQPGDIMQGQMLDVAMISESDRLEIEKIYEKLIEGKEDRRQLGERLEKIFRPYLLEV